MKAAEQIRVGDALCYLPDGTIGVARADQGFSLRERAIRRFGRIFRIPHLAHYHERPIIGIALGNAKKDGIVQVMTFGSTKGE